MITVRQLYEYALQHNYLDSNARVVLDTIGRERNLNSVNSVSIKDNVKESIVTPANNSSTIDLNKVEYTIEDLLILLTL